MKAFYLIENGKLNTGSGTQVPDPFIEYVIGEEPQELLEALEAEEIAMELQAKHQEAQTYLSSTDWYYARKAETGEEVPSEVVTKRQECREFLRTNQ